MVRVDARIQRGILYMGREFDPGPVPYFRGDWSWNNFYGHSHPFRWIIQEGLLSVTSESMCTKYWLTACSSLGSRTNILGQNIPCHFFTPRTKHPTKICHPGQNIPRCFCHPVHNILCHFCHPGQNVPCHFCQPGQNIPYSDCFFRVSLICDLHLLLHVLAVNALVWLSKWYKLDLKLIERQFHNVNRI